MSDSERELDATYFWPDPEEVWYAPEPEREPWTPPKRMDAYQGPSRFWRTYWDNEGAA